MANLGNFIYDISGYRVRTGYALNTFSHQGCEGLNETTAATSLGLLLAAKDEMGNCAQGDDAPEMKDRFWTEEFKTEFEQTAKPEEPFTPIQQEIFKKDEIETVEPVKKPKNKKNAWKVIWTKIKEEAEGLYDNVNQEMENNEEER